MIGRLVEQVRADEEGVAGEAVEEAAVGGPHVTRFAAHEEPADNPQAGAGGQAKR